MQHELHRKKVREWEEAETEEDLLRLQREFLNENAAPAATLSRRMAPPAIGKEGDLSDLPALETAADQDTSPKASAQIGEIVDKVKLPEEAPTAPTKPAPPKKLSLFAQRRRDAAGGATKPKRGPDDLLGEIIERESVKAPEFPSASTTETFTGEEDEVVGMVRAQVEKMAVGGGGNSSTYSHVDAENRGRIEGMSVEELREAQEELAGSLDVEALRSFFSKRQLDPVERARRTEEALKPAGKTVSFDIKSEEVKPEEKKAEVTKSEEVKSPEKDTPTGLRSQFPKSVPTEKDKLAWMDAELEKEVKGVEGRAQGLQQLSHEASKWRFNLQGEVIPPGTDLPASEGLHHHGDEPEKAGYTLQELLWLARSQNGAQRSVAWRVLTRLIQSVRWREGGLGEEEARSVYDLLLRLEFPMWVREGVVDGTLVVAVGAIDVLWLWVRDREEGCWGPAGEEKHLLRACRMIGVGERLQVILQAQTLPMDATERAREILEAMSSLETVSE